jgi:hypothetical protein
MRDGFHRARLLGFVTGLVNQEIRCIRQFRHGDAKQPVEARWLEMNGEVVDTSAD